MKIALLLVLAACGLHAQTTADRFDPGPDGTRWYSAHGAKRHDGGPCGTYDDVEIVNGKYWCVFVARTSISINGPAIALTAERESEANTERGLHSESSFGAPLIKIETVPATAVEPATNASGPYCPVEPYVLKWTVTQETRFLLSAGNVTYASDASFQAPNSEVVQVFKPLCVMPEKDAVATGPALDKLPALEIENLQGTLIPFNNNALTVADYRGDIALCKGKDNAHAVCELMNGATLAEVFKVMEDQFMRGADEDAKIIGTLRKELADAQAKLAQSKPAAK